MENEAMNDSYIKTSFPKRERKRMFINFSLPTLSDSFEDLLIEKHLALSLDFIDENLTLPQDEDDIFNIIFRGNSF